MNKVCLIGRITKDPEIKYTQSGTAVVSFTLAVDRRFKDGNGEKVTDFINCVAWRNQAEFIANYVVKGNSLAIEGSIQTRRYNVTQTESRMVVEIMVENVSNLTPKEQEQSDRTTYAEEEDLPF